MFNMGLLEYILYATDDGAFFFFPPQPSTCAAFFFFSPQVQIKHSLVFPSPSLISCGCLLHMLNTTRIKPQLLKKKKKQARDEQEEEDGSHQQNDHSTQAGGEELGANDSGDDYFPSDADIGDDTPRGTTDDEDLLPDGGDSETTESEDHGRGGIPPSISPSPVASDHEQQQQESEEAASESPATTESEQAAATSNDTGGEMPVSDSTDDDSDSDYNTDEDGGALNRRRVPAWMPDAVFRRTLQERYVLSHDLTQVLTNGGARAADLVFSKEVDVCPTNTRVLRICNRTSRLELDVVFYYREDLLNPDLSGLYVLPNCAISVVQNFIANGTGVTIAGKSMKNGLNSMPRTWVVPLELMVWLRASNLVHRNCNNMRLWLVDDVRDYLSVRFPAGEGAARVARVFGDLPGMLCLFEGEFFFVVFFGRGGGVMECREIFFSPPHP